MSAIAGSLWLWSRILWCQVRCWEVQDNGQTVPKAQQMHTGPVLDACWSDVSLLSKMIPSVNKPSYAKISNHLLCASSNRTGAKFSPRPVTKQPKCGISTATKPCRLHRLDKRSGRVAVALRSESSHTFCHVSLQHDGPIKSIHWIKAPNYSCIMTGSWDKTLKVGQCHTKKQKYFRVVYLAWFFFLLLLLIYLFFLVLGHSLSQPHDVSADARAKLLCRCRKWFIWTVVLCFTEVLSH